ncbi:MAG TPA: hypothetical protein VF382_05745, partial [Actinomycetota bacterium]
MPEAALTYGVLSQTHEEYDAKLWDTIRLFYRGGFELLKRAGEFLEPVPGEHTDRYAHRVKQASYICYFGQVVDYLVGALFHENLQVVPAKGAGGSSLGRVPDAKFYADFANNTDKSGTPFGAMAAQAVTTALLCRRAWIAVDLPEFDAVELPNRAAEDALGVNRAYAFEAPVEEVLNWHRDSDGKLLWLVTRWREIDRSSPFTEHKVYRERFKVWRSEGASVGWLTFETADHKLEEPCVPEEPLLLVDEGTTSFREIPFVELELPHGLWAGNKIGPLAIDHFRGRSDLAGALTTSMVEIPVVELAPEIPGVGEAMPAQAAQNPNRGNDPVGQYQRKGYMVLGAGDKLSFVGPSGRATDIADKRLDSLRDEIYRTVTAMSLSLSNSSATIGRSGDSKREDRSATEIVLGALGEIVRRAAVRVYDVVAGGRAEKVVWSAQGLSTFNVAAASELVAEATQALPLAIPSSTWRREYLTRLALGLVPNANPETKATIQKEIANGVDEADAL